MRDGIGPADALVIVDPQNDFCPGGALAVAGGDEIMGGIVELAMRFRAAGALIVVTQDWHPQRHQSFASSHEGAEPFGTAQMPYGEQVLWPDHCVEATPGAEFHPALRGAVDAAHLVVRKGYNPAVDSYSAFFENDKATSTGLGGWLKDKGVRRCFFVGLAYDFCVAYSALDAARRLGLEAVVLKDLTRAIAMPAGAGTTVDAAEASFREAGVAVADSREIAPEALPYSS
ncbi:MAG TPA: bifunctional nicotinamidase/pyrazinamidase [Allosphingosinicella sp.]